jgi:hypothetical protein
MFIKKFRKIIIKNNIIMQKDVLDIPFDDEPPTLVINISQYIKILKKKYGIS